MISQTMKGAKNTDRQFLKTMKCMTSQTKDMPFEKAKEFWKSIKCMTYQTRYSREKDIECFGDLNV